MADNHDANGKARSSIRNVVNDLLDNDPFLPDGMKDMVDNNIAFIDSNVGKVVCKELEELKREYHEVLTTYDAFPAKKDKEMKEAIDSQRKAHDKKLKDIEESHARSREWMEATISRLQQEMNSREARVRGLEQENSQRDSQNERLRWDLQRVQTQVNTLTSRYWVNPGYTSFSSQNTFNLYR